MSSTRLPQQALLENHYIDNRFQLQEKNDQFGNIFLYGKGTALFSIG